MTVNCVISSAASLILPLLLPFYLFTPHRERKIRVNSQDISIPALLPGKTYQFRVVGNSNLGPGESSEVI